MGRLEKVFVIFSLSYMIVYSVYFLYSMKAPDNFEGILPFHFLGMALSLGFLIIVIRDVFKRNFSNPNSKALWALAIIMFWPSVFIYLPKYGFKSRNVILESDNNKKFIIGFVLIIILLFGFMGYSIYSFMQGFENSGKTIDALAASGKDDEILAKVKNRSINNEELIGNGKWSPLHSAASNSRPSTVKILIDHGARINQKEKCNSNTPLHEAAEKGYYEVVKLLLDAGADKTILNNKNKTAFE